MVCNGNYWHYYLAKAVETKIYFSDAFKLSSHSMSLKDKYLHFIDESRKQVNAFKKNVVSAPVFVVNGNFCAFLNE